MGHKSARKMTNAENKNQVITKENFNFHAYKNHFILTVKLFGGVHFSFYLFSFRLDRRVRSMFIVRLAMIMCIKA